MNDGMLWIFICLVLLLWYFVWVLISLFGVFSSSWVSGLCIGRMLLLSSMVVMYSELELDIGGVLVGFMMI